MKTGSALALLLFSAVAAYATPALQKGSPQNAPAPPAQAVAATAQPLSFCPATANQEKAHLTFQPRLEAIPSICGPCSDSECVGAQIGDVCYYSGGQYYTCQLPYGNSCGGGTGRQCLCWTGPLP